MIVFVRHRSKKNEWLALLLTDLTLTAPEVICDEVGAPDWTLAFQQLLDLIHEVAVKAGKKFSALIQRQLQH